MAVSRTDKIRNESIIGMGDVWEMQLKVRWLAHVQKRDGEGIGGRMLRLKLEPRRSGGEAERS